MCRIARVDLAFQGSATPLRTRSFSGDRSPPEPMAPPFGEHASSPPPTGPARRPGTCASTSPTSPGSARSDEPAPQRRPPLRLRARGPDRGHRPNRRAGPRTGRRASCRPARARSRPARDRQASRGQPSHRRSFTPKPQDRHVEHIEDDAQVGVDKREGARGAGVDAKDDGHTSPFARPSTPFM